MSLCDSHIHLFENGYPGKYGTLFPKGGDIRVYEGIRKIHDIEKALVIGYEGEPWAKNNNAYIARLAKQHSWITPLAYWNLCRSANGKEFAKLWDKGFYGISLYLSGDSDIRQLSEWSDEGIAALNERHAIVSINAPMDLIEKLRPFFLRVFKAHILISHIGLPKLQDFFSTATHGMFMPLLRQSDIPHLQVKLSGLYACCDYPHHVLGKVLKRLGQEFGARRLCWGSDFPAALDAVSFTQTIHPVKGYFPGPDMKEVGGGNLRRMILSLKNKQNEKSIKTRSE